MLGTYCNLDSHEGTFLQNWRGKNLSATYLCQLESALMQDRKEFFRSAWTRCHEFSQVKWNEQMGYHKHSAICKCKSGHVIHPEHYSTVLETKCSTLNWHWIRPNVSSRSFRWMTNHSWLHINSYPQKLANITFLLSSLALANNNYPGRHLSLKMGTLLTESLCGA